MLQIGSAAGHGHFLVFNINVLRVIIANGKPAKLRLTHRAFDREFPTRNFCRGHIAVIISVSQFYHGSFRKSGDIASDHEAVVSLRKNKYREEQQNRQKCFHIIYGVFLLKSLSHRPSYSPWLATKLENGIEDRKPHLKINH